MVLAVAAAAVVWLVRATDENLAARGVTTGFDFLAHAARFSISESWLLSYTAGQDTYARALAVGAVNTAGVSMIAIVLATVAGTLLGLARLSRNWLLCHAAGLWVELMRNVPLPLHLLFWYQLLLQLPPTRQALRWGMVALSNRGLWLPALAWRDGGPVIEQAVLRGFNFEGGLLLSPELAALVLALTLYSSAFVAEIVRAGVRSVPRGQWDAAEALGLKRHQVLRLVVLPLSLRLVLPPLAGEYLNTIKNSSLAVVIGYPDLTALINTTLAETGRPLEAIALLMLAYLTISMPVSALMAAYARRTAFVLR